jgi:predicted metalloprotease
VLVLLVLGYLLTGDPTGLLNEGAPGGTAPAPAGPTGSPTDQDGQMVAAILGNTEDVFSQLFAKSNRKYQPPTLVLFTDAVASACGTNSAAVGPFYCPPDQRVYIDLGFYRELEQRFGAPGDFAQAYVIAHEVGHHVQNILGIFGANRRLAENANAVSVRQELQADCFAGVWGHYAKKDLDPNDVEEGLNAAAAIGDDNIQRRTQGRISPESWTHGSSEQRVRWFRTGLQSGDLNACDTSREG